MHPEFGPELPEFARALREFVPELPEFARALREFDGLVPAFGMEIAKYGEQLPTFAAQLPTFGLIPLQMSTLNESIVEDAALDWFGELGYAVGHGPHLAPGEHAGGTPAFSQGERESYGEVVLAGRLREVIRRLAPAVSETEPSGKADASTEQ